MLAISPEKCSSINFSRCRDPRVPLTLAGFDIPWSPLVKILGIWFTRSLCFTPHFRTVKTKVLKRLNYLKFITARSRGVTSFHMLKIVNSIVRSCLEYGAPLFFDSPPTPLNLLETSYNTAIHLATSLPIWTPILVLRWETGVLIFPADFLMLLGFFFFASCPLLRVCAWVTRRAVLLSFLPLVGNGSLHCNLFSVWKTICYPVFFASRGLPPPAAFI